MSELCDELHAYHNIQEVKHLEGSSEVEMWDSFLMTAHKIKQLLLFPRPNVPAAQTVIEQCLCYLVQLLDSWKAPRFYLRFIPAVW